MEPSIQRLKLLFLCNLLSWTNIFIKHTSMSLVDFLISWDGLREIVFLFSLSFLVLLGNRCVLWCTPFWRFYTICIYKKNKKIANLIH